MTLVLKRLNNFPIDGISCFISLLKNKFKNIKPNNRKGFTLIKIRLIFKAIKLIIYS